MSDDDQTVRVTVYDRVGQKPIVIFRVGTTEMHLEPDEAVKLAGLLKDAAKLARDPIERRKVARTGVMS